MDAPTKLADDPAMATVLAAFEIIVKHMRSRLERLESELKTAQRERDELRAELENYTNRGNGI
jgi:hypothetical protein